jgi:hypothetical protein
MSLARRKFLLDAAAGLVLVGLSSGAARAGVTERVYVDPVSGFAIHGFDPVAYFIKGKAEAGLAEHEAEWDNAVWRFASSGNAAAFLKDPDVYMPAFGGYDGESMLRGTPVASNPFLFSIVGQRVVLFRSTEGRDAFLAGGAASLEAAEAKWLALKPLLAP